MDIIKNRNKFFLVSIIIIGAGLLAMIFHAATGRGIFNFDVEFTGGTSMQINLEKDFKNEDVAKIVTAVTKQEAPQIQRVEGKTEVLIKTISLSQDERNQLIAEITKAYNLKPNDVLNVSDVSATVSGEMQRSALLAVFISCLAMLIYISFRFKDYHAGMSAILALLHDTLIVVAVYAVFRIPVNNSFIAAILTILGYSINATIVIFDRIRENKQKFRRDEQERLVNTSVIQTMNRSFNTSLTVLFTITAVYVFGVQSIKEFAMPLIIGIVGGTYSSICISGSIWYLFMMNNGKKRAVPAKQKS